MQRIRSLAVAAFASLVLAACGGGDGDQSPRVKYSKLVVFGDSLSDVGTYATPGVVASGGGKYTVNSATAKIWVELLAAQAGVAAPCAAQTGLESSGPLAGLAAPVTNVAGCFNYAQGGSRVTNPVGPANKALLALGNTDGYLGQLTDPLINQFQRHLAASGGSFAGDELVTVLAGGNDVFLNLATLSASVAAGQDPTVAGTAAVTAMGVAGGELAAYIKNLVVGKGAKYVVVVALPDISQTPFGLSLDAATRGLVQQMVVTFNAQVSAGLSGTAGILQVDAYAQGQDQTAHPDQYSVTNATTPACDPAKDPLGSLACSAATVIAGDVSHYQYADDVHPTPWGYSLLARFVAKRMLDNGWL
ncbi:SGNH/GDSL hydrolase family protein [soil metagenome]